MDYFVIDYKRLPHELVCKYKALNFVVWAHNFIVAKDFDFYYKHPNIARIINVGCEQKICTVIILWLTGWITFIMGF